MYNKNEFDSSKDYFNLFNKFTLYGEDYDIMYHIQYNLLPELIFTDAETMLNLINDERYNAIYDMIAATFKTKLYKDCPYKPTEFEVSNKLIDKNNKNINITIIKFNIKLIGILSKAIFITYNNNYKKVRYFTAENDTQDKNNKNIFLCEINKKGRKNHGGMVYNEDIILNKIIEVL